MPEPELTTASRFSGPIKTLGKLGNSLLAALVGTLLQDSSPADIGDFVQAMAEDIKRASTRRIVEPTIGLGNGDVTIR